jgi:HEAT repeat protein
MGREARDDGGEKMKHSAIYLLVIMLVFGIVTASRAETDYAQYLPKWLELLKIGNAREKKLALHSLWFLQYGEFRKDKKVFDPILEALKDKDPSIREAAAACLKAIGGDVLWSVDDEARSQNSGKGTIIAPALIKALLEDESPRVRAEAAKVLGKYGRYRSDRRGRSRVDKEEQAVEPLINALKDKDPWVRLNAAFSLGELEAQKAVQPLIALLEDNADWRNKYVQQEVIAALRKIGVLNMDIEFSRVLLKISGDEYLKAEILIQTQ